jgi:hypothetical protein
MVEISSSGSGGGPGRATSRGYPTTTAIIAGSWEPPQKIHGRGLRAKCCHQLLDLIFGSSGRLGQDLDEMFFVEYVAQLDERRQV